MSIDDRVQGPSAPSDPDDWPEGLAITRVLSRSPRAIVCEARDGDARFAVKILRRPRAVASTAPHEHRLEVLRAYGDGARTHALLMRLVVGRALPAWLDTLGPLPVPQALALTAGVARAAATIGPWGAHVEPEHALFGRYVDEPCRRGRAIVAHARRCADRAEGSAALAALGDLLALALTGRPRACAAALRWSERVRLGAALDLAVRCRRGDLPDLAALEHELEALGASRRAA